jgi:hypothetical protein
MTTTEKVADALTTIALILILPRLTAEWSTPTVLLTAVSFFVIGQVIALRGRNRRSPKEPSTST